MRYLSIYKTAEAVAPRRRSLMTEMGKLIEEMTRTGVLLATEGCLPTAKGARVRKFGEKMTVTDGPFTEAKEVVAGFALLEAKSKQEAIDLTKRFLGVAGDGECEIREIPPAREGSIEVRPVRALNPILRDAG